MQKLIFQKKVFILIHSYPTAVTQQAEDFLDNGCSDTAFLRDNGISIVYTRSACNNTDLIEVRESIYLLKEAD